MTDVMVEAITATLLGKIFEKDWAPERAVFLF